LILSPSLASATSLSTRDPSTSSNVYPVLIYLVMDSLNFWIWISCGESRSETCMPWWRE